MIDKPLTIVGIGLGRFVAHSLLFTTVTFTVSRDLGFGCTMHLILDRIWEEPKVLFFPFLGMLPSIHHTIYDFLRILLTNRTVQAWELIGLICLAIHSRVKS